MKLRIPFLCLLILCMVSCGNNNSGKRDGQMFIGTDGTSTMSKGFGSELFDMIDSVSIEYSASVIGKLVYSNGELILSGDVNKKISDKNIISKLLGFVEAFMMSRTEQIELSRTRRESVITDYPRVKYVVLSNENIIAQGSFHFGEEGYDIVYNPKFTAFVRVRTESHDSNTGACR